jgi:acrylyl-CoA reductase (NADPH)
LLGMDSVNMPIDRRREMWDRLATDLRPREIGRRYTEVTLETLDVALDGILAGAARGRWIVRIGAA